MMRIEKINVTFNAGTPIENTALSNLSITIKEGEFVTVIGSNGAGKSTLLNVVSGDTGTTSGRIYINDENVTKQSVSQRAKLVARVFQDPMAGTCGNLSIEENLALAYNRGQSYGLRSALNQHNRVLFKEKLALMNLGLEKRLTDRMGLLSGGQRQAISLLMASLQPSKILLLDEHTAALDPKTAAFVLKLTDQIVAENQLTTMMVTHSMRQALDHGNRTIMLHHGEIILDVSGDLRTKMDVADLLAMFQEKRGETLSDDALLLG